MRPARRIASILAVLLLALTLLRVWIYTTPAVGVGVSREDAPIRGLPHDASDIHFVIRPFTPVSSYSFVTDEASFREWSCGYLGLKNSTEGAATIQVIDPRLGISKVVAFPNAIKYSWSEADRGQYTLFDRNQGRAYYFSHTR